MIRLSHSALESLQTCERMFQLDRLLEGATAREEYPATVFGKAWGAGVASYLVTQDPDKALFDMFLSYFPQKEDDKKNQEICGSLLITAFSQLDILLQDWEIMTFSFKEEANKPAVELSFRLNIDETFYYVGYIDAVLRNKWTGRCAVMDAKSTGLLLMDLSPKFQNSGQCLGYSIVLDKIMGEDQSDYDVLYFAGQVGKSPFSGSNCKLYSFSKNLQDRLHWFISLGLDVKHLHEMLEMNIFPQRGGACLQYMRPCKYFGTCNLHSLDRYKEIEEDTIEYQFTYALDEVIEDHIRRIS